MAASCNGKTGQRSQHNDDDQSHHCDKQGVTHSLPVLHLADNVGEVIQCEHICIDEQRHLDNIFTGLERADNEVVNRDHHDHGRQQQTEFTEEFTCSSLLFH